MAPVPLIKNPEVGTSQWLVYCSIGLGSADSHAKNLYSGLTAKSLGGKRTIPVPVGGAETFSLASLEACWQVHKGVGYMFAG